MSETTTLCRYHGYTTGRPSKHQTPAPRDTQGTGTGTVNFELQWQRRFTACGSQEENEAHFPRSAKTAGAILTTIRLTGKVGMENAEGDSTPPS